MIGADRFGKVYVDGEFKFTTCKYITSLNFTLSPSGRQQLAVALNNFRPVAINYIGLVFNSSARSKQIDYSKYGHCTMKKPQAEEWFGFSFDSSAWPIGFYYIKESIIEEFYWQGPSQSSQNSRYSLSNACYSSPSLLKKLTFVPLICRNILSTSYSSSY